MPVTLSTCFVIVHDPEAALTFYRDELGLELRNDVAREGRIDQPPAGAS